MSLAVNMLFNPVTPEQALAFAKTQGRKWFTSGDLSAPGQFEYASCICVLYDLHREGKLNIKGIKRWKFQAVKNDL